MARQPKGRPTIYLGADGEHHVYLPNGTYPNGKPRRKHIHHKSAEVVAERIVEWEARKRQGHGQAAKIETVAQWMTRYAEIVRDEREYGTWRDVESMNRVWITPQIGGWRITGTRRRLEPDHVRAMYSAMRRAQLSDVYVKRCHTVLRRALRVAVREGRADRNVCDMFDGPSARKAKPQPLAQDHAVAVLRLALADPMAARWALGMVAGPRQSEVLGLRWHRCELDPPDGQPPYIWIKRKVQRRTWEHGCADPVACVRDRERKLCRTRPCPPRYAHGCAEGCERKLAHHCPQRVKVAGCSTHQRACPAPCKPDCAGHASTCPKRTGGGLVEGDPKTEKSEAPIPITHIVARLMREHRERQQRHHGDAWTDTGYVFARPDGRPLDPRADWEAWKRLLERAGVPHSKLHAARHTAGTFLRGSGADLDMVQEQLRHVDIATTRGYAGLALKAQHDALEKAAAALFDGEIMALIAARKGAEKVA